MKIEFNLSDEKDVEYACEVFEKFAQVLPLPKVVPTIDPCQNMVFSVQNALTEAAFVAALQYISFHAEKENVRINRQIGY